MRGVLEGRSPLAFAELSVKIKSKALLSLNFVM